MFDGKTLGAEVVAVVRDYVGRAFAPLSAKLIALEEHIATIPAGPKGDPGKDADHEFICAEIARLVAEIPRAKDGKDADESLIEKLLAPALERLEAKARALDSAIAEAKALPVAPASFLIDADGVLVAVYPDGVSKAIGAVRGRDGNRGASLMDGSVDSAGQLVMRMSDGRIINAGVIRGEPGKNGDPGTNGKDAASIAFLNGVDETKSYAEGTFAFYRGGTIRAQRQTDPIEGDIAKAGWAVMFDGIAQETEREIDDGRFIERTTTYTSGKTFRRLNQTAAMIYRGIWTDGDYMPGDTVTRDGSTWHCSRATSGVPGTSPDWKLCVKRGNHGKDALNGSRH